MKNFYYLLFVATIILSACSGDEDGSGDNTEFENQILGAWILDEIRVEGADCMSLFGDDVPESYQADEVGCAVPVEIQGNASRCINLEFLGNGEATFFWSEFSSTLDAPITYEIEGNTVRYCLVGSTCSGDYELVGSRLESVIDLDLEQDCKAVYVLKRK